MPQYRRLLIKLSGESLMGQRPGGLCMDSCATIANALTALSQAGYQLALVVGGGNFFRGVAGQNHRLARVPADQIGMLATIMNGLALAEALRHSGAAVSVMSSFACGTFVEPFSWQQARQRLAQHQILLFVGGTGNPYFTTNSAAALRANEIGADLFIKATNVDGVYEQDPKNHPDARKLPSLTYSEMLQRRLAVMDATAVALCRDNGMSIFVTNKQHLFDGALLTALPQQSSLQQMGSFISDTLT